MNNINLGDKVKCSITGFEGVVIGITHWIHGCRRCIVQPDKLDKEGKIKPTETFDEPQLTLIKAAKQKVDTGTRSTSTGGPIPAAVHKDGALRH